MLINFNLIPFDITCGRCKFQNDYYRPCPYAKKNGVAGGSECPYRIDGGTELCEDCVELMKEMEKYVRKEKGFDSTESLPEWVKRDMWNTFLNPE